MPKWSGGPGKKNQDLAATALCSATGGCPVKVFTLLGPAVLWFIAQKRLIAGSLLQELVEGGDDLVGGLGGHVHDLHEE